jgi:hypothetical protein
MSTSEAPEKLPPVFTKTYEATRKGWKEFGQEANVFHLAGYEVIAVSALGVKSFGAIWKSVRKDAVKYPDPLGVGDDDYPLDDDYVELA